MLLYDGDCAFCTRCAEVAVKILPEGMPVLAWQTIPDVERLGVTPAQLTEAAYFIDAGGVPRRGHEAIAYTIIATRKWYSPLGRLLLLPPISWIAKVVCAWVAKNRDKMPGGTAACAIDPNKSTPVTDSATQKSA